MRCRLVVLAMLSLGSTGAMADPNTDVLCPHQAEWVVEGEVARVTPVPALGGVRVTLEAVDYLKGTAPPGPLAFFMGGISLDRPLPVPAGQAYAGRAGGVVGDAGGAVFVEPGQRVLVLLTHASDPLAGLTYSSRTEGLFVRHASEVGAKPIAYGQRGHVLASTPCDRTSVAVEDVVDPAKRQVESFLSRIQYLEHPPYVEAASSWSDLVAEVRRCAAVACAATPTDGSETPPGDDAD